jgi:hypothetical protein
MSLTALFNVSEANALTQNLLTFSSITAAPYSVIWPRRHIDHSPHLGQWLSISEAIPPLPLPTFVVCKETTLPLNVLFTVHQNISV